MSDEYSTEEEETAVPVVHVKSRPKSASASPRKASARTKKGKKSTSKELLSAREAWLESLKSGEGVYRSRSPSSKALGKTPQEYFGDSLRRTGTGFHTTGKNNISGLSSSQQKYMAYKSTSHYLREVHGLEKPLKSKEPPVIRPAPGTPAYKSPEEYYDEVMELKKNVKDLKSENTTLKARYKRLEKEYGHKEKEVSKLLNPTSTDDFRRTLADKNTESSSVIHSLKQRILRLEQQLKDKEASYNKLHGDLKTTKIEELRVHKELYFKEMQRLRELKAGDVTLHQSRTLPEPSEGTNSTNIKELNKVIASVTAKNAKLREDNRRLQEDLDHVLKDQDRGDPSKEYQVMDRAELLAVVGKLEKRLSRAEREDGMSARRSRRDPPPDGKMVLEGSNLNEKLDQLDKRETQLLDELKAKNESILKLTEDRDHYRKQCDRLEADIKAISNGRPGSSGGRAGRDRPITPDRATTVSSSYYKRKSSRTSMGEVERFRENHAAKTIQRGWRGHRHERERETRSRREDELEALVRKNLENKAAKTIQGRWKNSRDDDATELIQAAIRGHNARKQQLRYMHEDDMISDTMSVASSTSEAAALVQATVRGHRTRRNELSRGPEKTRNGRGRALDSEGEDLDDDIEEDLNSGSEYSLPLQGYKAGSGRRAPSSVGNRSQGSRAQPQHSSNSRHSTAGASGKARQTSILDDSDDDDDEILSSSRSKKKGFF